MKNQPRKRVARSLRIFICILLGAIPFHSFAQLTVTSGVPAATLVANLVGAGMTVSNINLNCPSNAYGTFSNGASTNIGIGNGIMLTTGSAINAIGPNNSASAGTCNNTSANDAQLISVEPQATLDPCILEFDIVPQCNTLTINFVFGSEEYPEFVNASFNDAFGFWITGPGPACQAGFYNNTNVATLPNNVTPVSIDNVNSGNNPGFYVDNTGGTTIQYDGFTTVLTRNITLCPCQTYHWKIAIADAGDCIYDSGVFIDFMTCSTALTASAISTPSTCSGCTGTATASATGQGPFTYSWAPSGGNAATANNLCAGTYTCTVDDAISCSPPTTVAVTVGSSATPITTTNTQTNVTCNGGCNGSATATVTGGNGPFTYAWSPSGGNAATATNLCPGAYTCLITGAGGCTTTQSFTITQPSVVTASSVGTNISCFGGTNGTATANPAGGTPGYTFSWAPSGGNAVTANGLAAGSYTCTVADANGCTTTTSVTLTQPPSFTASSVGTNILCNGGTTGSATATPAGGAGGNIFSWAPSGGNAATANGLSAGTYTCTITDVNGCTATTSITLTEPTALTLATSGLPATCNAACDGQLIVIPNGGTSPYNFSWSTGCLSPSCSNICAGNYTITVTDANGCIATNPVAVTEPTAVTQATSSTPANCGAPDGTASTVANGGTGPYSYNWMPGGGNTATYSNIISGTYTCTVTDANGCTNTANIFVANTSGINITTQPVVNATCNGACDGSLTATGAGGTPPFTYAWAPSGGNASTASNLCAGTYTCTVNDANGCANTVTLTVTEPTQVTVTTPAQPPVVCSGTGTNLSATGAGGTPGYTYSWMPGNLAGNNPAVTPAATTTYTVTCTDANGCSATATEIITVNPNPVVALSGTPLSGCAPLTVPFTDLSTVTAPSTITGWQWDFGDNSTSTLQNPSHQYMNPGNYTVTLIVTTSDGCSATIVMANYVSVFASPVAGFTASPQPTTILESTVNFTDQSTGGASWLWNFGDVNNSSSTLQNPIFQFPDTGCYLVQQIVISANLCTDTTESLICIQPDWAIYVPNAFTPDGDGVNDVFIPMGVGISDKDYQFWIFDRWGNMIFYTDDRLKGWDGSVQGKGGDVAQIDTYVWKLKCRDVLDGRHKYVGKVSLIR